MNSKDLYSTADGIVYMMRDSRVRMVEHEAGPGSWNLEFEEWDSGEKRWKKYKLEDMLFDANILEALTKLAKHLEKIEP